MFSYFVHQCIHHHPSTIFGRTRWELHVCSVMCAQKQDPLSSQLERLDIVQLIPYTRELQQKEHQELNLCFSASMWTQVRHTSSRPQHVNFIDLFLQKTVFVNKLHRENC